MFLIAPIVAQGSAPQFVEGDLDTLSCKVLRVDCHQAKTADRDMQPIKKVRREDKRRMGLEKRKQKLPGSKGSGWRKKMDGTWVKVKE